MVRILPFTALDVCSPSSQLTKFNQFELISGMEVKDVIDALGGTAAAARLFDVGPSAVSNWKRENAFPERIHFRLFKLCQERGVKLPEKLLSTTSRSAA